MSTSLERGELDAISKESGQRSDLSIRAVAFGVLLGLFGVWSAGVRGDAYGQMTLYQNVMFTSEEPVNLAFIAALLTLTIMCLIVPRIFPRLKIGFTRAELAMAFAAGLGVHAIGVGFYNVVNKIGGFGHYAMTSRWALEAFDTTHPFVMPKDFDVMMDLLLGWADVPWGLWVVPIIFWFIVLFLLLVVPMCMGVIMRRRWAEHEQLTFPLARAVVHVLDVEDDGTGRVKGFLRNNLFWIGALITFSLVFYEWLQLELLPGLPVIHRNFLGRMLADFRATSPALDWAMRSPDAFRVGFRSWGVTGVLYLAPSHDFLFTWVIFTPLVWVVNYILYHIEAAPSSTWHRGVATTYFSLMFFAVMMAWRARADIAFNFRRAFSKKKDLEDEGLNIREAAIGLILGTIILFVVLTVFLKMNLLWTLGFFFFFYTCAFSVARFRSEVAFPSAGFMDLFYYRSTGMALSSPLRTYSQLQPSIKTLTGISFLNNHLRKFGPTLSMIHMLEGCRIADETNLKRRAFFKAYILGFALAAIPAAVMFLRAYYDVGTGMPEMHVVLGFSRLQVGHHVASDGTILGYAPEPDRIRYGLSFAAMVLVFAYLRANYIWWPFHPIGLIMAGNPNIPAHIATAALVVLISKGAILRYGGGALYIKLTPFFIGLVFGELVGFIVRWIGMGVLLGLG